MASTTNTSSLSSLSRTPVFTRPEKISVPSSGCSNVGLSSGTDTTIGEEDDEDTIVRGSWVWRNGQMWKISELLAAGPPKPSPPKRKYEFKPVFSRPLPSPQPKNDAVEVVSVQSHCDLHTPDRTPQTPDRLHDPDTHSPASSSPIYVRKPPLTSKPLVEASDDDIFGSDSDLDCEFKFEADFADDELEEDDEEDEDCDTLDPDSMVRHISAFLDPFTDSDDDDEDLDFE